MRVARRLLELESVGLLRVGVLAHFYAGELVARVAILRLPDYTLIRVEAALVAAFGRAYTPRLIGETVDAYFPSGHLQLRISGLSMPSA